MIRTLWIVRSVKARIRFIQAAFQQFKDFLTPVCHLVAVAVFDGRAADFRDLGNLFSSKAVALFPKYPRRIVAGDRANKSITIDRSHRLKHIPLNGGLCDAKNDRQPVLADTLPDADWDNPPKIKVCFPRSGSPSLKVPAVMPLSDKFSLFRT